MNAEPEQPLLKKTNETSERLSQRLTLALRASGIGVWEYNVVAGTINWDEQMYALYGITSDTFSGAYEAWEKGLHPDDLEQGRKDLTDALAGIRKFDTEFRVVWPSGEVRDIHAIADVFHDESGNPSHMYGVNTDITDEKKLRADLEQHNKDLRHFSHIAAHDLREPCRRQCAITQIIIEDHAESLPADLKKLLQQVDQQANHMLGLINSFRSLTNIGTQALESEELQMRDVIQSVLGEFEDKLTAVTVDCRTQVVAVGYLNLVQILLRNIISNAIKYGSANMHLSFYDEIHLGKQTIVIENTCEALLESRADLFQPFVRSTDKADGQGMGLSICKRVIDLHGGSIWIEPVSNLFRIKFNLESSH